MKKIFKFFIYLIILIALLLIGAYFYINSQITIKEFGPIQTTSMPYVGIKAVNVEMKDYEEIFAKAYSRLEKFEKEHKDVKFIQPFTIYEINPHNKNSYNLIIAYETKELANNIHDDSFVIGTRKPINAIEYKMTGSYTYLSYAWFYAYLKTGFSKKVEIDENQPPLEIYEKNITNTKNPKDFVTNIYIPVVLK